MVTLNTQNNKKMLTRTDKPLSLRAQRFARFLFQGKTQLQAWQLAGYSTNYCEEFQRIHATNLANSTRVKLVLRHLQDQQDLTVINSPTSRRRILTDLSKDAETPPHARISAIDVHNKMDRLYSESSQTNVYVNKVDINVLREKLMARIAASTTLSINERKDGEGGL